MSEIKPALSREEWASEIEEGTLPVQAGEYHDALYGYASPGSVNPEAVAALALYGRITWEMVDALRYVADGEGLYDRFSDVDCWKSEELEAAMDAAEKIADLLESLLPPRDLTKSLPAK